MRLLSRRLWVWALVASILTPLYAAQEPNAGDDTQVVGEPPPPLPPSAARRPRPAARRPSPPSARTSYTGVPGSISGSIEDQLGEPMPGVSIRIGDSKGDGQTTIATANASFEFTGLRPGAYALDFTEPGFARTRIEIDIAEGDRVTQAVVLPIDTREETLHVTPTGPRVPAVPRTELERFLATRVAPSASPPARPCATGRPCVTPARKIVDRQPTYPPDAVSIGAEGLVFLDARITRDGLVADVRPMIAETRELGEAAVSAVREWQFEPARLNGVAVETSMTVTVEFSLK